MNKRILLSIFASLFLVSLLSFSSAYYYPDESHSSVTILTTKNTPYEYKTTSFEVLSDKTSFMGYADSHTTISSSVNEYPKYRYYSPTYSPKYYTYQTNLRSDSTDWRYKPSYSYEDYYNQQAYDDYYYYPRYSFLRNAYNWNW